MAENTSITVTRSVDIPAKDLFNILSNPERHPEIDGSGFVVSDDKTDRISGQGDVFRMNMHGDHMGGDYKTENHVTGFEENKFISWQTAPAGEEPPGWEWIWELTSTGSDSADIRLTYDWSKVDQETVNQIGFPLVTEDQLEASLGRLAAAATGV
ncbi:SRPBCC family protein [Rothia halotolerans]|uniref:SRPBCC family protein n=1 Tax=Rothia halotolerans TaxID=405770 RepID=UPI00101BEA2E|nr:SRPBCC family protein [Rothia halotolerans]